MVYNYICNVDSILIFAYGIFWLSTLDSNKISEHPVSLFHTFSSLSFTNKCSVHYIFCRYSHFTTKIIIQTSWIFNLSASLWHLAGAHLTKCFHCLHFPLLSDWKIFALNGPHSFFLFLLISGFHVYHESFCGHLTMLIWFFFFPFIVLFSRSIMRALWVGSQNLHKALLLCAWGQLSWIEGSWVMLSMFRDFLDLCYFPVVNDRSSFNLKRLLKCFACVIIIADSSRLKIFFLYLHMYIFFSFWKIFM